MLNVVNASVKNLRVSAQKARLVADLVRGMAVEQALNVLTFSVKKASDMIKTLLESAMANAEHNFGIDIDTLYIKTLVVDKARSMKRMMPRAKGRSNKIEKQLCHVTIVLSSH